MEDNNLIKRPPRIQPELPHGENPIPPPPDQSKARQQPWIQMLLPFVMIVGYLLMSVFGRGRNLLFMLPMGMSMVASVGYAIYARGKAKEDEGVAEAAYLEKLVELRDEMNLSHDMQKRFYRHNYPDVQTVYQISKVANHATLNLNGSVSSATSTRLWERRSSDEDFGAVRIGVGTRPSTVRYIADGQGSFDDLLMRDALRLQEDSLYVDEVPITIPLRPTTEKDREDGTGEARFAIGVTGNNPKGIYAFIHALVMNYSVFHAPTEAQVLLLSTDVSAGHWGWIQSLPHNHGVCFESEVDRERDDESGQVSLFLKSLRQEYEERERRMKDPEYQSDISLPFRLVVVDLLDLPLGSGLEGIETDTALSLLMNKGNQLGGAVLFLVPDTREVPTDCHAVIDVTVSARQNGQTSSVIFRYAETGLNSPRYTGKADIISDQKTLEEFAKFLKPLDVPKSYGGGIPSGVLMFDMLGVSDADDLQKQLMTNWERSMYPPEKGEDKGKTISYEKDYSGWLRNKLGMMSDGTYRTLRYSADADGVHGLIAGSTGSGKSELLMTMILDMAFRYDPSIVNFVLVDFKGGGAFKPLEALPHVVDVVTNLGESAVERMFAAITAELNRRQAINTNTDSKHIVHYRKNELHLPDENGQFGQLIEVRGEEVETAPYPHLFVFIDEFAEMIATNPEYKAQLNSITRLGRALGVTLILAAQRPTGVTDQMRANIKFRIALRVETREESSEVLRRPDAAYLPTGTPGRGYLQVGNENIELIQVAWSGNDYKGPEASQADEEKPVLWRDRQKLAGSTDEDEAPKVFEVMVKTMNEVAGIISLPQRKPWPDFLPDEMSLQHHVDMYKDYWTGSGSAIILGDHEAKVGNDGKRYAPISWAVDQWMDHQSGWEELDWHGDAMRTTVGLIDDPYSAKQHPLLIDFRRGHAVVFGASGWGKTTFLRTLIAGLASTHSPADLHIYILDFGGQQLMSLQKLPHVGAIIIPDESERVERVLTILDRLLDERKRELSDAGARDLYEFNTKFPSKHLPAVLLAIDNFAEFRESFDGLVPLLVSIARESRSLGIHFVLSAELPNVLSGKLYSLFSERVALKLSDPGEYSGIVGRGARDLEEIPGRGYVKLDRRPLLCQVALIAGRKEDQDKPIDELENLTLLIQYMQSHLDQNPNILPETARPRTIDELAKRKLLEELLVVNQLEAESGKRRSIRPVLGIEDINLKHWHFDIVKKGPHCMIVGPPSSGKTTLLRSLTLSLADMYEPSDVTIVLVDTRRRLFDYYGKRKLSELPHVVEAISEEDQLPALPDKLQAEIDNPERDRKPIFVLIDNYDSFSEDAEANRKAKVIERLGKLARERGQDGLHFIIAGSMGMPRDALRKQIMSCSYGIGMKTGEATQQLNGKVSKSVLAAEQPDGRGFVVKSGRTFKVQIACPYHSDDSIEEDLDRWVRPIDNRYYHERNQWCYAPPKSEDDENVEAGNQSAGNLSTRQDPGETKKLLEDREAIVVYEKVPDDVDVELLRTKLIEGKFPAVILKHYTPLQMYTLAIEKKLIEPPKPENK